MVAEKEDYFRKPRQKRKIEGIDKEAMAQGYADWGSFNLEYANGAITAENEAGQMISDLIGND